MFDGLDDPIWVYFVHSLAAETDKDVIATCDYGGEVVAAAARENIWSTQFHPEKSSRVGLRILADFAVAATSHRHGPSAGQCLLADFTGPPNDRRAAKPAASGSAGQPQVEQAEPPGP